jgi:CARDB
MARKRTFIRFQMQEVAMRRRTFLAGMLCAQVIAFATASTMTAQEQCRVAIGTVEGIGASGSLDTIHVTGRATACTSVEVRLACQERGGARRVEVRDGHWELDFSLEEARRAGCSCPGKIAVDLVCVGEAACTDQVRQSLECRPPQPLAFQHAVTFICGKASKGIAAPGVYATAINVHNPSEVAASFRKKFAVGLPEQRSGLITPFFSGRLGPDAAMEIDCPEIMKRTDGREFVKGFAVIESDTALDVVAIYSAAGRDGMVSTMDIERVPPRRREGCLGPDLVVESIPRPGWDDINRRSVLQAVIRNVGDSAADPSFALIRDPSTVDPGSGVPYEVAAAVPALGPGESATVTFYLPYWVYNPDASLEVIADYKRVVDECDGSNNTRAFNDRG